MPPQKVIEARVYKKSNNHLHMRTVPSSESIMSEGFFSALDKAYTDEVVGVYNADDRERRGNVHIRFLVLILKRM